MVARSTLYVISLGKGQTVNGVRLTLIAVADRALDVPRALNPFRREAASRENRGLNRPATSARAGQHEQTESGVRDMSAQGLPVQRGGPVSPPDPGEPATLVASSHMNGLLARPFFVTNGKRGRTRSVTSMSASL